MINRYESADLQRERDEMDGNKPVNGDDDEWGVGASD